MTPRTDSVERISLSQCASKRTNDSPPAITKCGSIRIPDLRVQFAILDEAVWIESFWLRIHHRVMQNRPARYRDNDQSKQIREKLR